MPAAIQTTPMLPGLSPVRGRAIVARFDGGLMSSDGGLLALREVELRLGIARRLAACIHDARAPGRLMHGLDSIMGFRMLMIAAGYEDGNDAGALRRDPMFKLAMDRLPEQRDLCSQPTISRLENTPGARALLRMGQAMVAHYCESFRQVPRRIVLDIDDTFDTVHGGQQLRLFNAHHDEYGFQPIVVFDGEGRMIAAVLRPACRPSGRMIVKWLRRLITAIRANWPLVEIMLSIPVESSPNVPIENSPVRYGSVATISAWRLDLGEVGQIEVDDDLERLGRGGVAQAIWQVIGPGGVFGLQSEQLGDGGVPALRPGAAIGRSTVADGNSRLFRLAGAISSLALRVGKHLACFCWQVFRHDRFRYVTLDKQESGDAAQAACIVSAATLGGRPRRFG